MITLLLTAFLPFLPLPIFTFYCNRMSLCSHLHRSIHFSLLEFKLFLNNICVLVGLMGQTSVDVNQIEITMTMQSIFLVNLHL